MNIFVGGLPFKVDEGELREIFEKYGELTSVKLIVDKQSGRSKGLTIRSNAKTPIKVIYIKGEVVASPAG